METYKCSLILDKCSCGKGIFSKWRLGKNFVGTKELKTIVIFTTCKGIVHVWEDNITSATAKHKILNGDYGFDFTFPYDKLLQELEEGKYERDYSY